MTPIEGFIGGAYDLPTVPARAQRCINLQLESTPSGQALIGTPGLVSQFTLPTSPVRGGDVMNGRTFMVGGNTLYEVTTGVPVALGTLSTSTGKVGIANNDTTLLIVDGVAGYTFDGTFSVISDVDFPNGVTQVGWEGQYFLVGVDGSKKFYVSTLGTASAWNGLDFASAENKPEVLRALIINHDRLMLFTTTGAEQWANTGNAELAFERDNGSSIEVGIEAPDTLVKMNNGLFWLGQDKDGGGMVFTLQGGVPQRISTHQLDKLLQSVDRSDAYAIAIQMEGHATYCLTVPALEQTFVYDSATQKWHDRATWNGSAFTRWRPVCHVYSKQHLVGDYQTGDVFSVESEVFTDNGLPMRRVRSCPPIIPGWQRVTFPRFAVEAEMGNTHGGEQTLALRWSNDGGKRFKAYRCLSLGAIGQTTKRAITYLCGNMREGGRRVFEITTVSDAKVALYNAYADIQADQ